MLYVYCRAASALQEAAAEHKKRTGRPFVLIIDAVDRLAEHAPDILETLQARHLSSAMLSVCSCSSSSCTQDVPASQVKVDKQKSLCTSCQHKLLMFVEWHK